MYKLSNIVLTERTRTIARTRSNMYCNCSYGAKLSKGNRFLFSVSGGTAMGSQVRQNTV